MTLGELRNQLANISEDVDLDTTVFVEVEYNNVISYIQDVCIDDDGEVRIVI